MSVEEKLDNVIELLENQTKDDDKDSWYQRWEFWIAILGIGIWAINTYCGLYSMNGAIVPHQISAFINSLPVP